MTDMNMHAHSFLYIFPPLSKNSHFGITPSMNNERLRKLAIAEKIKIKNIPTNNYTPV
jgi:hypothetical protein